MKDFKLRLRQWTPWIAALIALLLCAPIPSSAQQSPAARRIQTYYQELMPTLRAAGSLSVRQRDQRFGPAITSAFDIGTMARLATGPTWNSFSGAQQAAVREAFARFLVADYAHQVSDYSGESFVVEPQTSAESRGDWSPLPHWLLLARIRNAHRGLPEWPLPCGSPSGHR